MRLAADLKDPFKFEGRSTPGQQHWFAITTSKGLERQNVSFLELTQRLASRRASGLQGFLSLYVAVFDSSRRLKHSARKISRTSAFTEDFSGYTPGYNGSIHG